MFCRTSLDGYLIYLVFICNPCQSLTALFKLWNKNLAVTNVKLDGFSKDIIRAENIQITRKLDKVQTFVE